jgi:hypothetical protein
MNHKSGESASQRLNRHTQGASRHTDGLPS